MSYKEIPNLLYSGKKVYVKSSVGGGTLPQVPMGVEGQDYNSPRSVFLINILHNRAIRDNYTYYDENFNKLGKLMDIGQSPQTHNDSYHFENGDQKGQFDVIYYDDQAVQQPVQPGGNLPQVPMGVEGQDYNSPRSVFLSNILQDRANRDYYTFYDENNNKLGQIVDIGQSPQTHNDSYFFSSSENPNGAQKGQFDVIYYDDQSGRQPVQPGGRRRKTRGRKSGKRRRTRRSRR